MSTHDEIEAVSAILRRCAKPCIVELGGYHGEDSEWMLKAVKGKNPTYIMVEADHENILAIRGIGFGGSALIHGAIAAYTGECDFWACYTEEGRGSGSIRQPTGHLQEKPWYDFQKLPEKINCYSLDFIFEDQKLDHIDVLWVDIQGAERDMITGGEKALRNSRYLFIESEQRELYDGQALRQELLSMLPDWSIVGFFEHNLLLKNNAFSSQYELECDEPELPQVAKATPAGCPVCKSQAIGLAGGMKRCNQCGHQFR